MPPAIGTLKNWPVAVVATLFGERKAPDGTPLGH